MLFDFRHRTRASLSTLSTLSTLFIASLCASSAHAQEEEETLSPLPAASPPSAPAAAPAQTAPASPPPPIENEEAPAEGPLRQGFTLELGLGAALTHVSPDNGTSQTKVGLAPLSLGLGGFLTPDIALLARAAGTSYFEKGANGDTSQFVSAFYGAHLQYWFTDRFMMSAGPGFMLFGENAFLTPAEKPVTGYGASVRAGYAVLAIKHHVLRFSLELFPAKFKDASVLGSALNFEWQYF